VYSQAFSCHSNKGQLEPVLLSVILSHRHIDLQLSVPGWHGLAEATSDDVMFASDIVAAFLEMFSADGEPLSAFRNWVDLWCLL
jgi:hypothetical protein